MVEVTQEDLLAPKQLHIFHATKTLLQVLYAQAFMVLALAAPARYAGTGQSMEYP